MDTPSRPGSARWAGASAQARGPATSAPLHSRPTPGVDLGGISGAYAPTKTCLNAVTIQYAKEPNGTDVLINSACPGYVAADLSAFSGTQAPEQGAATAIRLAALPDDGRTGGFFGGTGIVPW